MDAPMPRICIKMSDVFPDSSPWLSDHCTVIDADRRMRRFLRKEEEREANGEPELGTFMQRYGTFCYEDGRIDERAEK